MRSADELGDHIVCQGGTFYNDAVLRAFEKIAGVNVVRPNIAGLMGAYGAALIAEKNYQAGDRTSLLSVKEMANLSFDKEYMHCGGCANNCELTLTIFNDGRKFVTGNRCERGEARALEITVFYTFFVYIVAFLYFYACVDDWDHLDVIFFHFSDKLRKIVKIFVQSKILV